MGALIGALYASGLSAKQLENIFSKIHLKQLIRMVDISWHQTGGLVRGDKLISFLRSKIKCKYFKELKIPLKIVATDFWGRTSKVFEKGDIIDAVRASTSIPGVFEPVVIGNRVLTDGGAVNPIPYDLIRKDCDILIAIDVFGAVPHQVGKIKPSILECIHSAYLTTQESIVRSKLAISQPDILSGISLSHIRTLDFHRLDEILKGVKDDVSRFKAKLKKVLANS